MDFIASKLQNLISVSLHLHIPPAGNEVWQRGVQHAGQLPWFPFITSSVEMMT
jgi:hypothetical protein